LSHFFCASMGRSNGKQWDRQRATKRYQIQAAQKKSGLRVPSRVGEIVTTM
jgi:hypothetical protein